MYGLVLCHLFPQAITQSDLSLRLNWNGTCNVALYLDGTKNITSDSHKQPILRKLVCVCVLGYTREKKSDNCHSIIFSSLHTLLHTSHTSPKKRRTWCPFYLSSFFHQHLCLFSLLQNKVFFLCKKKKAPSTLTIATSQQKTTYKSETWTLQPWLCARKHMIHADSGAHTCMHMKTHIKTEGLKFRDFTFVFKKRHIRVYK